MVNWGNAGRIAGKAFPIVFNTIGVPLDYMAGKAEGEDDFRAGAGAVASGLGGWKGALAGAGLGSALGPAGTLAGGIAGGMAGSFAGGWTADRLDETVRGKQTLASNTGARNNMSQAVRLENGDVAEVDDNGNIVGWLVKGGVVLAGGNAIYNVTREIAQNPINPVQTYQGFQQAYNTMNPSGVGMVNNMAAGQSMAGQVGSQLRTNVGQGLRNTGNNIGRVWNAIPGNNAVKATAGLVLAADQLTGANLSRGVGRAIGGSIDAVTNAVGLKTDFDGQNKVSQQQIKQNNEAARVDDNLDISNRYDQAIYEQGFRNRQEMEDYNTRLWNREKEEANRIFQEKDRIARRNYLTEFTAKQAGDLLTNYSNMPESVARGVAAIYQATGR